MLGEQELVSSDWWEHLSLHSTPLLSLLPLLSFPFPSTRTVTSQHKKMVLYSLSWVEPHLIPVPNSTIRDGNLLCEWWLLRNRTSVSPSVQEVACSVDFSGLFQLYSS